MPLPRVIPNLRVRAHDALGAHPLDQPPRVLDRNPTPPLGDTEQPGLHLRLSEQFAAVAGADAELLVRLPHRVVLPLEFHLAGFLDVGAEQVPGAVDGPVAEGAVAGESERSWHQGGRVVEEISDHGWEKWNVSYETWRTVVIVTVQMRENAIVSLIAAATQIVGGTDLFFYRALRPCFSSPLEMLM